MGPSIAPIRGLSVTSRAVSCNQGVGVLPAIQRRSVHAGIALASIWVICATRAVVTVLNSGGRDNRSSNMRERLRTEWMPGAEWQA